MSQEDVLTSQLTILLHIGAGMLPAHEGSPTLLLFYWSVLGGSYSEGWVDDLTGILRGSRTMAVHLGSGVDPYSLVIGYGQSLLIAAALYSPASGIAVPDPQRGSPLARKRSAGIGCRFQEAKSVDSVGDELLLNTAFASGPVSVVSGPTITWLTPEIRRVRPRC